MSQQNKVETKTQINKGAPKAKLEESKDEQPRPKTTQDNRRGGRGGRGGQRGGKRAEGEEEGDQKKPQQQRREQDKNSWVYKYHNDERPTYDRVKVTLETEIPALPTKEEMLKNPVKEVFDAKMQKLDAQISEVRSAQKELHTKRREVIDGGKMSGGNVTYREELTKQIDLLREDNKKKRACQAQMKEV
jgi:hypothetical protein